MASSGSFETTSHINQSLAFKWSIKSQSIADNTTTISWQLVDAGTYSGTWVACGAFYLVIDGEVILDYPESHRIRVYEGTVVASGEKTLKHNADGTRSFSASCQAGIYLYARNCSGSGTFTINQIPRQANLTAAPNFNDEANPTITYSNSAGNNVTSLQACISLTGAKDDIAYRDISKTGTSYTFNLTETERNVLRQNTIGSNSRSVTFFVRTVIAGNTYHSTLKRTFTIVNGNPVISNASVVDTDSKCISLTGDANKLIRYYSDAKASFTSTVKKYATVKATSIDNTITTINSNSGTFSNTSSAVFNFSLTDNRGNKVTHKITKTMVNYVKISCNMNLTAPSAKGNMNFVINGNCFKGSFGAVSNTLSVQYRYKVNDGSYGSWIHATATWNGNNYTANVALEGLDYRCKYTFQARAIDQLATATTAEQSVRTPPVFDWGENDFNFNVPVLMNGHTVLKHDSTSNNTILSTSGGYIYIRPGGADDTGAEVLITPQGNIQLSGDIIINGKSLKSLLGIS